MWSGMRIAAVLVVRGHHVRPERTDQLDQAADSPRPRRGWRRSPPAAAAADRPPEVRSRRSPARPVRCRGSARARSISARRISAMLASTSGRSIAGLRIEPRSPPVHVATTTSTPSATYLAVVAAPLLDSSSGCACTCSRRSLSPSASVRGPREFIAAHVATRSAFRGVPLPPVETAPPSAQNGDVPQPRAIRRQSAPDAERIRRRYPPPRIPEPVLVACRSRSRRRRRLADLGRHRGRQPAGRRPDLGVHGAVRHPDHRHPDRRPTEPGAAGRLPGGGAGHRLPAGRRAGRPGARLRRPGSSNVRRPDHTRRATTRGPRVLAD